MFKGITLASAALFSGLVFAGATATTCPNLNDLTSLQSAYQEVKPIVPGKLYSSIKVYELETGESWVVFIGPIKARNGDSVFDLADYILARASVNGEMVNTEEGAVCMYESGMPGLYISAMNGDFDDQQNQIKQLVKKVQK